jgi:hypothetical protein
MVIMEKLIEPLRLRIVKCAELEPPFGSKAKMAMVGRQVSFNCEPAHP